GATFARGVRGGARSIGEQASTGGPVQQQASMRISKPVRAFHKLSLAEVIVGCIGCAVMAAAFLADQAWFDRHFLPSFWTPREEIIEIEQRARLGVAIAGAIIILFLRKPVARGLRKDPFYLFTIALAVALAIGTAEFLLRVRAAHKSPELSDRLRHWDAYLGCFVDRSHTRHEMLLGRD